MSENNDEEIRNVLKELIDNEDETTEKILNKKRKKEHKLLQPIKNIMINVILFMGILLIAILIREIYAGIEIKNYKENNNLSVLYSPDSNVDTIIYNSLKIENVILLIGTIIIIVRSIVKIWKYIPNVKNLKKNKLMIILMILLAIEIEIMILIVYLKINYNLNVDASDFNYIVAV